MPRRTDSNSPADWLHSARSDLAGIQVLAGQRLSYPLCSSKLAEVLEKALKAELIRSGWRLERTHDLLRLGGELRSRGSDLVDKVRPLCEMLSERYFAERYPGFDVEDEDWPSLDGLVEAVADVLSTVERRVRP